MVFTGLFQFGAATEKAKKQQRIKFLIDKYPFIKTDTWTTTSNFDNFINTTN